MANLYVIAIKSGDRIRALAWTGARSPRAAWSRFMSEWARFYEGDNRKAKIARAKQKDGAHIIKVAVPCDSVH